MAPTSPDPAASDAEKNSYKQAVNDAQDGLHTLYKMGGKYKEASRAAFQGLQDLWRGGGSPNGREKKSIERGMKAIDALDQTDPKTVVAIGAISHVFSNLDPAKVKKYTHGFGPPNHPGKEIHDDPRDTFKDIPGVGGVISNPLEVLHVLTDRNTWLRVGEGLLGLLLIGIGVAAVTKGTPIGSAIRKGATLAATKGMSKGA